MKYKTLAPFVLLYILSLLFFSPSNMDDFRQFNSDSSIKLLFLFFFALLLLGSTCPKLRVRTMYSAAVFCCQTVQVGPGWSHPPKGVQVPCPCSSTKKPSSPLFPPPHVQSQLYQEDEECHSWVVTCFMSS